MPQVQKECSLFQAPVAVVVATDVLFYFIFLWFNGGSHPVTLTGSKEAGAGGPAWCRMYGHADRNPG